MRFAVPVSIVLLLCVPAWAGDVSAKDAEKIVERFEKAVDKVNRAQLASPKADDEDELANKLPASARKGLARLIGMKDGDAKWQALIAYGRQAAELDLEDDLAKIEKALEKAPESERGEFGLYISRPRFLLHAARTNREYAEAFADAVDGILEAYDKTFGFKEFSKVPGKKIRVLLHKEERPRPPQFAPQYKYHSTIDFPIGNDKLFYSPTNDGKFLFYGLCHELGHLIAMWGDRNNQEDHHAWAHYTGVVIVDACVKAPWAKKLKDRRWRSVDVDRKKTADVEPSAESREGVLRILIELHDLVGPKRIGDALNLMDEKRMGHRINQVRYYSLAEFQKALLAGTKKKKQKAKIKALFEG